MQIRYIFPVVIFALVLPLIAYGAAQEQPADAGTSNERSVLIRKGCNALAAGFLPLIFFARALELTLDLFIKYW